MGSHICRGPDGYNLLGFLSAVGAFATLDRAWRARNVKMHWVNQGGWHPVLQADGPSTEDDVIDAIYKELGKRKINIVDEQGCLIDNTNKLTVEAFRKQAAELAQSASAHDRSDADFLCAMAGEVLTREGYVEDTALRALTGAGHQNFLETMSKLVESTNREQIAIALFRRWEYEKARGMSFRYDPIEDRRYALRATDPRSEQILTVPGANRLVIEAFDFFPTFPNRSGLLTTGFVGSEIMWPIWAVPISVMTLKSLLLRPEIYNPEIQANDLRRIGVVRVFTSRRILVGKYRNFTPARPRL